MYKITWEYTRPSSDTPWPAKNETVGDLLTAAPGFLGKELVVSEDQLSRTFVSQWATEEEFLNFRNANSVLLDQINTDLESHCQSNGITITKSTETV